MHFRFGVAVCSVICAATLWAADTPSADVHPAFWVESSQLEIGPVTAGTAATATFVFHNEGDADVHILRAAPSWGCTVAEFDSVIPAGGSGTLTAKMHTKTSQSGRVSKYVNVVTDADGSDNIRLRFTVDVRMPIEVQPAFRFVLNTTEGAGSSQRVLLRRNDGEPLVVRRTKVPISEVTVTAVPVTDESLKSAESKQAAPTPWGAAETPRGVEARLGDVWLEMKVGSSLVAGRYSDVVRVATDDPEAPEIDIPYTIRVRPLINARPAVVRMWTAPTIDAPGRSAIVTLQHYGDRKFKVTGVEVSHPKVFSAVAYGDDASTQQSIRIGLTEGLDAETLGASLEGWIHIATDDPEKPVIEIPVLVAPTRTLSRRPVDGHR